MTRVFKNCTSKNSRGGAKKDTDPVQKLKDILNNIHKVHRENGKIVKFEQVKEKSEESKENDV